MADFTSFLADMDQVAYVRSAELTEGDGRGCRIIDVFNGSGLAFTVAPDRGMNIVECSYRGIPVAFRSPSGHVAPGKFGPEEWLRNWEGGLLTTCGLRHAGPPEEGGQLRRLARRGVRAHRLRSSPRGVDVRGESAPCAHHPDRLR